MGFNLKLWVKNKELVKEKTPETKVYQTGYNQTFFVDGNQGRNGQGTFMDKKNELIEEEKSFIAIDLEGMKMFLYDKGKEKDSFEVLSKGKEGSWWETPTGFYTALNKEINHFSSIGEVWMPWSIQFYGNFFIHGRPYYSNGEPVPDGYSGGCIRLKDENVEEVFNFAEKGMPILVYDKEEKPSLYSKVVPLDSVAKVPQVSAEAVLVGDLDTGETILNKNSDSVMPIASLAKLMTATVASELIYLEREVIITPEMLKDSVQSYPLSAGKSYKAFDMLYPLLAQSSNGAGRAIASMMGEEYFVYQMNKKAESLNMTETKFVDPGGVEAGNISTLHDVLKMAKYILEKRRFIYDISKGKDYSIFGSNVFSGIETFNEFSDDPRLVGAKNGESSSAGKTYASVWKFEKDNIPRYFFIGVLDSENRESDVKNIIKWLENNFGL